MTLSNITVTIIFVGISALLKVLEKEIEEEKRVFEQY